MSNIFGGPPLSFFCYLSDRRSSCAQSPLPRACRRRGAQPFFCLPRVSTLLLVFWRPTANRILSFSPRCGLQAPFVVLFCRLLAARSLRAVAMRANKLELRFLCAHFFFFLVRGTIAGGSGSRGCGCLCASSDFHGDNSAVGVRNRLGRRRSTIAKMPRLFLYFEPLA